MTTLAARLAQLSQLAGSHTMAEHLRAIVGRFSLPLVAPYTVAAVLVAYSGLPAGLHTVAEHLAVERSVEQQSVAYYGAGGHGRTAARTHVEDDAEIERKVRSWWDAFDAQRAAERAAEAALQQARSGAATEGRRAVEAPVRDVVEAALAIDDEAAAVLTALLASEPAPRSAGLTADEQALVLAIVAASHQA